MIQKIIGSNNDYLELEKWFFESVRQGNLLLVHDDSLKFLDAFKNKLNEISEKTGIQITYFNDFNLIRFMKAS